MLVTQCHDTPKHTHKYMWSRPWIWPGYISSLFQPFFSISAILVASVQFSCSVVSDSLWPHELQHAKCPCPSPTPRVHPNPCPFCRWCHPTISSSVVPFSSWFQSPSIKVFSNESVLCIRWPKYWSFTFSMSPSNEYSGLISFRIEWLDLLAVQGALKSLLQHHS